MKCVPNGAKLTIFCRKITKVFQRLVDPPSDPLCNMVFLHQFVHHAAWDNFRKNYVIFWFKPPIPLRRAWNNDTKLLLKYSNRSRWCVFGFVFCVKEAVANWVSLFLEPTVKLKLKTAHRISKPWSQLRKKQLYSVTWKPEFLRC